MVASGIQIDVKSQGEEYAKKLVKSGNRRMDVDDFQVEKSYYDALWGEEHEEMESILCESAFHRHYA